MRVVLADTTLADSRRALRVLETSSPPTFYIPAQDVRTDLLERAAHETLCEWKGAARYWSARVGERTVASVAWSVPEPFEGFEALRDHLAFFPGRVDACTVGDELVRPQPGDYYGGWITRDVVGPFKGPPGTEGW